MPYDDRPFQMPDELEGLGVADALTLAELDDDDMLDAVAGAMGIAPGRFRAAINNFRPPPKGTPWPRAVGKGPQVINKAIADVKRQARSRGDDAKPDGWVPNPQFFFGAVKSGDSATTAASQLVAADGTMPLLGRDGSSKGQNLNYNTLLGDAMQTNLDLDSTRVRLGYELTLREIAMCFDFAPAGLFTAAQIFDLLHSASLMLYHGGGGRAQVTQAIGLFEVPVMVNGVLVNWGGAGGQANPQGYLVPVRDGYKLRYPIDLPADKPNLLALEGLGAGAGSLGALFNSTLIAGQRIAIRAVFPKAIFKRKAS